MEVPLFVPAIFVLFNYLLYMEMVVWAQNIATFVITKESCSTIPTIICNFVWKTCRTAVHFLFVILWNNCMHIPVVSIKNQKNCNLIKWINFPHFAICVSIYSAGLQCFRGFRNERKTTSKRLTHQLLIIMKQCNSTHHFLLPFQPLY